jgi:hypothetical protein
MSLPPKFTSSHSPDGSFPDAGGFVIRSSTHARGGGGGSDFLSSTNNQQTHTMYSKFTTLLKAALCAVLALGGITTATAEDKAPSATGTWTWTTPGRNGGAERKMTLTLAQDGEKLTGKLSSPGRDGAAARESEISEGSVKGADVTFSVTREFNGNKITSKYTGKLTADTITGKITGKDRDGADQSRDWTAKKEAAK